MPHCASNGRCWWTHLTHTCGLRDYPNTYSCCRGLAHLAFTLLTQPVGHPPSLATEPRWTQFSSYLSTYSVFQRTRLKPEVHSKPSLPLTSHIWLLPRSYLVSFQRHYFVLFNWGPGFVLWFLKAWINLGLGLLVIFQYRLKSFFFFKRKLCLYLGLTFLGFQKR